LMDQVIKLVDIRRVYRMGATDVRALDGISLEMERGSYWAVTGHSGSGKSTLLNLLGCLDRPTCGEYWLNGVNAATLADDALSEHRLRNLGFIFQSFHLIPQLTVQENIELPMFYRGIEVSARAARARALANTVGLASRLRHRPTELSGGQRQRVAIARALANNPAVILADEPTGNLDTATGGQIMDLLDELHAEGRTIVMVTHEPEIARRAQRHMQLCDGRIQDRNGAAA